MARAVFADTSGLMAQFLAGDPHHAAAGEEVRRLLRAGRRFVSTNYVFDELVTAVRRRAGFEASRRVGEAARSSAVIGWIYLDAALEARAWALYLKYHDHELSFTDAAGMAVMQMNDVTEVLTFDDDFAKAGFMKLPA